MRSPAYVLPWDVIKKSMREVILYPLKRYFLPHGNTASNPQDTKQNSNMTCTLTYTCMLLLHIINTEQAVPGNTSWMDMEKKWHPLFGFKKIIRTKFSSLP
jgi:hypothetical protein